MNCYCQITDPTFVQSAFNYTAFIPPDDLQYNPFKCWYGYIPPPIFY